MRASLPVSGSSRPCVSDRPQGLQHSRFKGGRREKRCQAFRGEAEAQEFVQVGVIGGTHGLQGEVRVQSTSDFPEDRLEKPGPKWIQQPKRGLAAAATSAFRQVDSLGGRSHVYKGHSLWILKFKDIDTPEDAALLNGSQLMVASEERKALPQDEYYIQQLIGLDVVQEGEGEEEVIGRVDSVYLGNGSPDILFVQRHCDPKAKWTNFYQFCDLLNVGCVILARPVLLPFVKDFVPVVDLETGTLRVTPPEGLLELSEAKHLPQSEGPRREQESAAIDAL